MNCLIRLTKECMRRNSENEKNESLARREEISLNTRDREKDGVSFGVSV